MQRTRTVAEAIASCPIVRSDRAAPAAEARTTQRRAQTGELVRLVPGVWAPRSIFAELWPEHRHAVRTIGALPRRRGDVVVSHLSAAALHGWTIDAPWPDRIHVTGVGSERRSANRTFVVHADPGMLEVDPDVLAHLGVRATTRARTAADLARLLPFRDAVCVLDQALRGGVERTRILQELRARSGTGLRKAVTALDFADPEAANIGESLMRVLFRRIGLPDPVCQMGFTDGATRAFVDFWFPDAGVIVEFDGEQKYRDPVFLAGRSPERAVIDEKHREDWLRSSRDVRGFVRFGWRHRDAAEAVRARLEQVGLRADRAASRSRSPSRLDEERIAP